MFNASAAWLRAAAAAGLIATLSQGDIERAQQIARGTEAERARFHAAYTFALGDPTVPELDVITPFRRAVIVTEDHLRRGDWLFSRSVRSLEEALAPARGIVTISARVRFNPLNAYVSVPPFTLALAGTADVGLSAVDTRTTPEFSLPFKSAAGKGTALIGATLEADVPAGRVESAVSRIGVLLEGKEIGATVVDFRALQ
jgi:hypothetical protein